MPPRRTPGGRTHRPAVGAVACGVAVLVLLGALHASAPTASRVQFLFTSDSHYGLTRAAFRGGANVAAHVVNAALVAAMNDVPAATFPKDGGIGGGEPIGAIDFVVNGGDIANREEQTSEGATVQPAATSWAEFEADYERGLTVRDAEGQRSPLYAVPGNHDVSNAIGFYRRMVPETDGSALAAIYNLMMAPEVPLTGTTLSYPRDRVDTSREVGGLHVVFLTVWPDSPQRTWLERDLARVPAGTPVFIFTHDQPDAEAKHFINPNGRHDLNETDAFENLLADQLSDGTTNKTPSTIEQRALEGVLRAHPNVTAYFHGNSNWNQFYDWTGPDHTVAIHTFRVDSPMKGAFSATDETRLSFQVATVDLVSLTMTVRECLWNAQPSIPHAPLAWGGSTTVAISPHR
jgi:hypothetical protein